MQLLNARSLVCITAQEHHSWSPHATPDTSALDVSGRPEQTGIQEGVWPLLPILLQSCGDMLDVCSTIAFNTGAHNRKSTNLSFEERGWCRSQAVPGSERLERSKGAHTKLSHDMCSFSRCLSAVQKEPGHSRSAVKLWRVGLFDISAYPAEWWIALGGAIKERVSLASKTFHQLL